MVHLQVEELWAERQMRVENELQDLEKQNYSFFQPAIVRNPYQIAPLTAMLIFQTEQSTKVQVSILDRMGQVELQYECPSCKNHRVPIYGLYADWQNKIKLEQEDGQSCLLTIRTDKIPEILLKGSTEGLLAKQEWIFTVPVSGCGYPAAYDQNGECRWYLTEELAFKFTRAKNGRILTCGPALLSPPYSPTSLWEMELTGKIIKEYRVPGGVYNDFFEMADGSLLLLNQRFERGTTEDMCVLMDRESGDVLRTWDFRALLPMNQGGSPSQSAGDWFHASSVWYDARTDSLTVAGKHQDIIINLDFHAGTINWILGDAHGWPADLVERYFFQAEDPSFQWCYEMNCAQLLSDGTILCFDNGHYRSKKGQPYLECEERYSRVVRYKLDIANKKISEIWSFGQEQGSAFYSPYLSNCLVEQEGNYLINSGGIGFLAGKSAEPPAYFAQAVTAEVEMKTRIIAWQQGAVLYELQLPINCYYAEKIDITQFNHKVSTEKGRIIGKRLGSAVFELDLEWEEAGMLDSTYQFSAKQTSEQLLVSGRFWQGEMVMLLLEGTETIPFYMQTTRDPYLTMTKNTVTGGAERPLVYAVSLQGLSGQYEICVGIDNKKYHTAIWFDC